MQIADRRPAASWRSALRAHARAHPITTLALLGAGLAVAALFVASAVRVAAGDAGTAVRYALLGGAAGFAATGLGALPGAVLRSLPQRVEDVMLGFAAGMMLAASAFSLLLPGLEAGERILGAAIPGALVVVLGMALGVVLMLGLDEFTPHEHAKTGPCGAGNERCPRMWLFVFAIALHNLPEGMAIGVSFAQGDLGVGLPLTAAIAIQDVPEGLAIAMALRSAGYPVRLSVLLGVASGLPEPIGALLGVGLAGGLALAYPIGLGLAGGAMIFVVSHEVIPETHRNGHQTPATIGLMAGFALMTVLDTGLG